MTFFKTNLSKVHHHPGLHSEHSIDTLFVRWMRLKYRLIIMLPFLGRFHTPPPSPQWEEICGNYERIWRNMWEIWKNMTEHEENMEDYEGIWRNMWRIWRNTPYYSLEKSSLYRLWDLEERSARCKSLSIAFFL